MIPLNINNSLLEFLAKNETTLVVITDALGKIVWANRGFELATGYGLDEVLGRKPGDFLQGDKTNQETIDQMRYAFSDRKPFKVDILNYSKDGSEYWINIDASPIFDENGEFVSFIAIQHKISETKKFELELAESLEKLKWQNFELADAIITAERESEIRETFEKENYKTQEILLETQKVAKIGSWEVDLIANTVYWSEVTREIHEVSADFVPNIAEGINFYHPDYRDLITKRVESALFEGHSFDDKMIFITQKGNEIWVRAIGYPIFEKGAVTKIRGVFQDVNNEKLAELELKRNEKELIETVLKLNSIINNTQSSIYAIDNNFNYTAFNKSHAESVERLIGKELLPGTNIKDALPKDYTDSIISNLSRALKGETFSSIQEFELNESKSYYESTLNPIIKDEAVIGATIFTTNITDRIQKENLIKESEERFKSISSNSPFGIYLTDVKGYCSYTNEKYQEITGLTLEEALGEGWVSALHHDDKQNIFELWAEAVQKTNFEFKHKYRFIDKKDKVSWVEVTAVEVFNDDELNGYLGFVEDITQKIETANELSKVQSLQRAIIDNASYALIATNTDGTIISYNNAAEKLLGYKAEELVGIRKPGVFHLPNEVFARTEEISKELGIDIEIGFDTFVAKTKLGLENEYEWTYVHKDGSHIPVILSISALRDAENNINGFLGIAKDISLEKNAIAEKFNAIANIRSLVENTNDSIWSVDLDYRLLSFNINFKTDFKVSFGVDIEIGMRIIDYLPYGLKEIWTERYSRSNNGERYNFDEYFPVEGNDLYFEITFNPIMDESSKIIGSTIFAKNITERKKNEFQLREYSKFIESISNTTPSLINIYDLKAKEYVYQNKDIIDYLKYTEFSKKPKKFELIQFIHPDDKDIFINALPEYHNLKENEIRYSQFRLLNGDGKYIWVQSREVVFDRNDNDFPTQILFIADDITKQKEAELQLLESSERLRLATTGTSIGIWDWNLAQKELIWDESNYKLFGVINEDFDNTFEKFISYISVEKRDYVSKTINVAIKKGKDFSVEYSIINTNQNLNKWKQRFIRTEAKVILDDNSQVIRIIGVNYDVTQRRLYEENLKKAMDEAQSANQAKSSFLANMSHEIRTPMNAILGFAELMQFENLEPKQKEFANGIISSGKSLLTLINDILDLSKIEAGKMTIKKEQTNIRSLCNDIQQVFSIKCKESGIEFKLNINQELPEMLFIDEVRVRQILFNIVGNAVKFTHSGYVALNIDFKRQQKTDLMLDLIIEVEDTGIGIPEQQQKLIFDAFRQQDEQSTRKYGGTGLGLTITRRLAEMMDGKIELSSEMNVGSKFIVYLEDVVYLNSIYEKKEIEVTAKKDHKYLNSKILVVDDTLANQLVVKGFLKAFTNLSLKIVNNGQLALDELAENSDYDLVLMDIQMPVMDGFEATRQIRKDVKFDKMPIIALTAYAMADDLKEFEKIFNGIVTKPIVRAELLDAIAKYRGDETENGIEIVEIIENLKNLDWKFSSEENLKLFKLKFTSNAENYKQTIDLEAIKAMTIEIRLFATAKNESFLFAKCNLLEEALNSFNISAILKILNEISII